MKAGNKYEMKDVLHEDDLRKITSRADAKGKPVNFHFVRIGKRLRCIAASYSGQKTRTDA